MTTRFVPAGEIQSRYETHRPKVLTLHITKQAQFFDISNDQQLSDIELLRSSVELVGEPGRTLAGNPIQTPSGHVSGAYSPSLFPATTADPNYMSTINSLYDINKTGSSTVFGTTVKNAIVHQHHIDHGWVDVQVSGLFDNANFIRDQSQGTSIFDLVLPTDSGLLSSRSVQQNGPPHRFELQGLKIDNRLQVNVAFLGSAPINLRQARFVEDFVQTNPDKYINADGTYIYYDQATGDCQIPSNCISQMILQFKITPSSNL